MKTGLKWIIELIFFNNVYIIYDYSKRRKKLVRKKQHFFVNNQKIKNRLKKKSLKKKSLKKKNKKI